MLERAPSTRTRSCRCAFALRDLLERHASSWARSARQQKPHLWHVTAASVSSWVGLHLATATLGSPASAASSRHVRARRGPRAARRRAPQPLRVSSARSLRHSPQLHRRIASAPRLPHARPLLPMRSSLPQRHRTGSAQTYPCVPRGSLRLSPPPQHPTASAPSSQPATLANSRLLRPRAPLTEPAVP
jgi:hypothetical protein